VTRSGPLGIAAGDGLGSSSDLLSGLLAPVLGLPDTLEDGHRLAPSPGPVVVTTDVFSVDPITFPGGDIGSLAACGAINDLAASGARMTSCTLGIFASAHLDVALLERCLRSFANLVSAEGAQIVAGDTKVHPDRRPELLLFVTALGSLVTPTTSFDLVKTEAGDDIFVTGPLGDHSIAVLSAREGLGFESVVQSDAHPLSTPVLELAEADLVHSVRDLTRGGLVAALWDAHEATGLAFEVRGAELPIGDRTRAAAEMLGLDVMALTNEGCMFITAPRESRDRVFEVLGRHPETKGVSLIGSVGAGPSAGPTIIDERESSRVIPLPRGLGVPRLC
jgi:hydrogenase expression/formation protein HypE